MSKQLVAFEYSNSPLPGPGPLVTKAEYLPDGATVADLARLFPEHVDEHGNASGIPMVDGGIQFWVSAARKLEDGDWFWSGVLRIELVDLAAERRKLLNAEIREAELRGEVSRLRLLHE